MLYLELPSRRAVPSQLFVSSGTATELGRIDHLVSISTKDQSPFRFSLTNLVINSSHRSAHRRSGNGDRLVEGDGFDG